MVGDVGPQSPAVVVVDVGVADGDLSHVPFHAAGFPVTARWRVWLWASSGPSRWWGRCPVRRGGSRWRRCRRCRAGRCRVVAAEDLHAVGGEEAGPAVVEGRDVADYPAAGVGVGLDGGALPVAGVVPDGDGVQGDAAGGAGERRFQVASAVQHCAWFPAEGVARPGLDAEVAQVGAGFDQVGGAGGVGVHHLLGDVADADGDRGPAGAPGRRRRGRRTGRRWGGCTAREGGPAGQGDHETGGAEDRGRRGWP